MDNILFSNKNINAIQKNINKIINIKQSDETQMKLNKFIKNRMSYIYDKHKYKQNNYNNVKDFILTLNKLCFVECINEYKSKVKREKNRTPQYQTDEYDQTLDVVNKDSEGAFINPLKNINLNNNMGKENIAEDYNNGMEYSPFKMINGYGDCNGLYEDTCGNIKQQSKNNFLKTIENNDNSKNENNANFEKEIMMRQYQDNRANTFSNMNIPDSNNKSNNIDNQNDGNFFNFLQSNNNNMGNDFDEAYTKIETIDKKFDDNININARLQQLEKERSNDINYASENTNKFNPMISPHNNPGSKNPNLSGIGVDTNIWEQKKVSPTDNISESFFSNKNPAIFSNKLPNNMNNYSDIQQKKEMNNNIIEEIINPNINSEINDASKMYIDNNKLEKLLSYIQGKEKEIGTIKCQYEEQKREYEIKNQLLENIINEKLSGKNKIDVKKYFRDASSAGIQRMIDNLKKDIDNNNKKKTGQKNKTEKNKTEGNKNINIFVEQINSDNYALPNSAYDYNVYLKKEYRNVKSIVLDEYKFNRNNYNITKFVNKFILNIDNVEHLMEFYEGTYSIIDIIDSLNEFMITKDLHIEIKINEDNKIYIKNNNEIPFDIICTDETIHELLGFNSNNKGKNYYEVDIDDISRDWTFDLEKESNLDIEQNYIPTFLENKLFMLVKIKKEKIKFFEIDFDSKSPITLNFDKPIDINEIHFMFKKNKSLNGSYYDIKSHEFKLYFYSK